MHKKSFRLAFFAMLYFVQGVGLAYFHNFQKPYLDSFAIDADLIGILTSILLLPFILKIFIGMVSDRVNLLGRGHRIPYIVLGILLASAAFVGLSFVSPGEEFTLYLLLAVMASFAVTIFDSTADGLAVDITPDDEYSQVQGIMVGGRAVGFIILSVIIGLIAQSAGYRPVFLIIAACMLLPLFWVLRAKEPAETSRIGFEWAAFKAMLKPVVIIFVIYSILYSIVSFGVDGLITFHMSQTFHAPESLIGTYGALRGIGAVIGAVAGGVLMKKLGAKKMAYLALALLSIAAILLGFAPGISMLLIMGVIWGAAWGFQETFYLSFAMRLTDPRIAASMFALMMAISNIGAAIGEGVATGLTDNLGFQPVFFILAAFNVVVVPFVFMIFKTLQQAEG